MTSAGHHVMLGGASAPLPYLREVAWIGTDGVAYTALTHVHGDARHAKVEMSFLTLPNFNYRYSGIFQKNLFGCTTNDSYALQCNFNDGSTAWEFQVYSANAMVRKKNVTTGSHDVVATRDDNILTLTFDGYTSSATNAYNDMTKGRLGIFTQNNYGPGNGVSPMPNRVPKNVAISKFKYWDGDVLCADLLPVEGFDGHGAFFDKVNDELLVNLAGLGAFTAGPASRGGVS